MFLISEIERFALAQYSPAGEPVRLWITPWVIPISAFRQSLSTDQTYTSTLTVSANADFILTDVSAFFPGANASGLATVLSADAIADGKSAPDVRLLITDNSTGDSFMDRPVLINSWATNGTVDRSFTIPRFVPGRNALTIQINVGSYAYPGGGDLALHGALVRAYDAGSGSEITRGAVR